MKQEITSHSVRRASSCPLKCIRLTFLFFQALNLIALNPRASKATTAAGNLDNNTANLKHMPNLKQLYQVIVNVKIFKGWVRKQHRPKNWWGPGKDTTQSVYLTVGCRSDSERVEVRDAKLLFCQCVLLP